LDREQIRAQVAKVLDMAPDEIDDDHNLADLGMGSMDLMALVNGWRKAGLRVPFDKLVEEPTLASWLRELEAVA
jgi:bifunctional isochorismate lyase/aryl carrier protein